MYMGILRALKLEKKFTVGGGLGVILVGVEVLPGAGTLEAVFASCARTPPLKKKNR